MEIATGSLGDNFLRKRYIKQIVLLFTLFSLLFYSCFELVSPSTALSASWFRRSYPSNIFELVIGVPFTGPNPPAVTCARLQYKVEIFSLQGWLDVSGGWQNANNQVLRQFNVSQSNVTFYYSIPDQPVVRIMFRNAVTQFICEIREVKWKEFTGKTGEKISVNQNGTRFYHGIFIPRLSCCGN